MVGCMVEMLSILLVFEEDTKIFGKNEIVGQKYFKDAPKDSLLVTSIFYTLQGEGPYRGHPAVFVRLAKCNLACSFCDTYFDSGDWLTFEQIERKIMQQLETYFGNPPPSWLFNDQRRYLDIGLVITGGEPTLQANLNEWLLSVQDSFQWIQIESNGIRLCKLPESTTVVVSPKCSEKDGKPVKYLKPSENTLKRANCLKFVMCADADSPYNNIPDWGLKWHRDTGREIFVSPMNIYNYQPQQAKVDKASNKTTIEQRSAVDEVVSFWTSGLLNVGENEKNHTYTAEYCLKHGLTYNLQAHLYAGLA